MVFSPRSRQLLASVLIIAISFASIPQVTMAAGGEAETSQERYKKIAEELKVAETEYEDAKRAFLQFWEQRLPAEEYIEAKRVVGALLFLVLGGLTLYAAGLQLGLLSLASQMASGMALDKLELSKEEIQTFALARAEVLRLKAEVAKIEKDILEHELRLKKNKAIYDKFLAQLPLASSDDERDDLLSNFTVRCQRKEITDEESTSCSGYKLNAAGQKEEILNSLIKWTYEPDYHPLAYIGSISGAEVEKSLPLPVEIKVTGTLDLLKEEGGGARGQSRLRSWSPRKPRPTSA